MIKLSNHTSAHLLASYLKQQGVSNSVSFDDGEYLLTINNSSDFNKAQHIIEHFIRYPDHPQYQEAAWQQGEVVETQATLSSTTKMDTAINALRTSPVVVLVGVVCILIYGLSLLDGFQFVRQQMMIQSFNELSNSAQWWRIVTPAFIHFSELHIIFNLLWWWVLGRQLEATFGSSLLLLFLVLTATVSNIAQYLVSGPSFGGMSGVVYALMGFVWWMGWLKPSWGLNLDKPIIGFMLIWLVIGYFDVLWVSMANTAHTAGLLSGCALAWLLAQNAKTNPRKDI